MKIANGFLDFQSDFQWKRQGDNIIEKVWFFLDRIYRINLKFFDLVNPVYPV